MTSALRQLSALLALRWQMLRGLSRRAVVVLALLLLAWLVRVIVGSGAALDTAVLATAVQVAPTAFLGFGALAVVAPLTAGGGHELVPPDQLVVYPVRARTHFLGGLVLAPANLVWVVQLLSLAALTAYLTLGGSLWRGALTTGLYVAALTVLGQALAWTVTGLRRTRRGRQVSTAAFVVAVLALVGTVQSGLGGAALDASPTRSVVAAVVAGGEADTTSWLPTTVVLAAAVLAGLVMGTAACSWALRRPGDAGSNRHTEPVRRRAPARGPLRELVAVDRASVWRAPALRRGGLVLAVLPGLVGASSAVPWESLVVLPGLVAAGAGLLFGVNAFALDASGALWLASLPHDPLLGLKSKAIVLTETVLAAVVLAAVAGSVRTPGSPTGAQLSAIVVSGIACTAVVVAGCLRSSVRRPHRADLRGPRDAIAPPGALALASARLAVPTALVGIVLASASATRDPWAPAVLAVPIVLAAVLSVLRTTRRYREPVLRARVVQAVSAG